MGFLDTTGSGGWQFEFCKQTFSKRKIRELPEDLRAALAANCLRGALPPVDLRAVCC